MQDPDLTNEKVVKVNSCKIPHDQKWIAANWISRKRHTWTTSKNAKTFKSEAHDDMWITSAWMDSRLHTQRPSRGVRMKVITWCRVPDWRLFKVPDERMSKVTTVHDASGPQSVPKTSDLVGWKILPKMLNNVVTHGLNVLLFDSPISQVLWGRIEISN